MFLPGRDCLCRKEAPRLGRLSSPLCWRCSGLAVGAAALLAGLLGGASWLGLSRVGVARPVAAKQTPAQTAGQKAQRRLAEADAKAREALKARLKTLEGFFRRGRSGAKPFAEDALSWSG